MRVSACLLLSLFCAACAATESGDHRRPLPFHIAIAPLSMDHVREVPKAGSDGKDTDYMRLVPDTGWIKALTSTLTGSLRELAFAQVTPLDAEAADATRVEDAIERDTRLINEAREKGADLLLCLDFSFQPVIRQETSPTFWVNLPLFALGGPFGWFLPDRTYYVEATVSGWFYDPRTLARGTLDAPLNTTRTEIASALRRTEKMDLNFLARTQGDVGYCLWSCVWPCGMLASDREEAAKELLDRIVKQQLGPGLASSVLDQRVVFQRGEGPFFLDLEKSKLEPGARSGNVVLRGSACLTPTREIESLSSWTVQVEGHPALTRSFDDGPPPKQDTTLLRFDFEENLGPLPDGTHVRLQIEAGERTPRVRSYTFRVQRPKAP